jgi:hypothetical protein
MSRESDADQRVFGYVQSGASCGKATPSIAAMLTVSPFRHMSHDRIDVFALGKALNFTANVISMTK